MSEQIPKIGISCFVSFYYYFFVEKLSLTILSIEKLITLWPTRKLEKSCFTIWLYLSWKFSLWVFCRKIFRESTFLILLWWKFILQTFPQIRSDPKNVISHHHRRWNIQFFNWRGTLSKIIFCWLKTARRWVVSFFFVLLNSFCCYSFISWKWWNFLVTYLSDFN